MSLALFGDYLSRESCSIKTYAFPFISKLGLAYLEAGHSLDIFTSSTEVDHLTIIDEGRVRLYIGRRRSSARARGLDLFRVERNDIKAAIRSAQPDIIHAHWTYEYASAAMSVQPDALVTAHDSPQVLVRYYRHPYWWLRALLGVITIRRVQNLSVVSPSLIPEITVWTKKHLVPQVIPNGIARGSDDGGRNVSGSRTQLKRAAMPTFACIANGFDSRKNTSSAIRAFALLQLVIPDAQLELYGVDHEHDGPAHRWTQSVSLTKNVHFNGSMDHDQLLNQLDERVDVLLHTSVWEACSLAILEAQSRGIPVIGGEHSGGVPFTLDYGNAGILTDVTSPERISEAMMRLVTDIDRYKECSNFAINNVRMKFDFDPIASLYIRKLTSILNRRSLTGMQNAGDASSLNGDSEVVIKVLMTTFNRVASTIACLNSLFAADLRPTVQLEVILVDASSSDGTIDQVEALGEKIQTHTVSSEHFWAMGMRTAWELAQESHYDYLFWLNDDVILNKDSIEILLDLATATSEQRVVLGAVASVSDGQITYSGFRKESNLRPLRLTRLLPSGAPQECDTLNGNIVFAPSGCDHRVGGFPAHYSHALADLAYGFELRRREIPIILAPIPLGLCERQEAAEPWLDRSRPVSSRLHALQGPKGLPFGIWLRFCIRYGGFLGLVNGLKPYVLVLSSAAVNQLERRR